MVQSFGRKAGGPRKVGTDYIYWTFSAAAQSIAAFVAFLLSGYALVHSLMESVRERDDTLEEVQAELRKTYHDRLRWLAWLTGAAIILSLIIVYFNRQDAPVSDWAIVLVGVVDLAAIVSGLVFVVAIVDPERYRRAAAKALREAATPPATRNPSKEFFDRIAVILGPMTSPGNVPSESAPAPAPASPVEDFFHAFVHLERLLRDYLRKNDLYLPSRGVPRMSFSFRQMVEALHAAERIDEGFYRELMDLSKYRNLVFHGHMAQVDAVMVQRCRDAAARLEKLT